MFRRAGMVLILPRSGFVARDPTSFGPTSGFRHSITRRALQHLAQHVGHAERLEVDRIDAGPPHLLAEQLAARRDRKRDGAGNWLGGRQFTQEMHALRGPDALDTP